MHRSRLLPLSFALILSATALAANAQNSENTDTPEITGAARMDVRISQLEEQMRNMQGTIEQLGNDNKQLKAQLDKANADTQYRLQALEGKQPSGSAAASSTAPTAAAPGESSPFVNAVVPTPAGPSFATARDHYSYAFGLITHAKYADAADSFEAFTRQYPHDPLIGNAFYWLGETYYVRRDYVKAADNFRQGFQAMPSGPKAADNLLKLAMSLNAQKKDKEACVVLKQVISKYDSTGGGVKPRAQEEINRIGCN